MPKIPILGKPTTPSLIIVNNFKLVFFFSNQTEMSTKLLGGSCLLGRLTRQAASRFYFDDALFRPRFFLLLDFFVSFESGLFGFVLLGL